MKKFFSLAAVMLILGTVSICYGFAPDNRDCAKCHTLKNEEAQNILDDINKDKQFKVVEINPGPLSGIWEIIFDVGEKKGIIYVDYSKKYIVAGSLFAMKTKTNLTQKRYVELNKDILEKERVQQEKAQREQAEPPKVDVTQIPLEDALVLGEATAAIKVIVFDDPD